METKKCSKCQTVKNINEFYKNAGNCKPCQHAYNKKHNQKNIERYRKYQNKAVKKIYKRGQTLMNKHRAIVGCQKCGEKRYWMIDYHHLDPSTKDHPVTYYKTSSMKALKREIRKCIPLCRNCHADFHYQEKTNKIKIENYLE
jgi:hypothetical protein